MQNLMLRLGMEEDVPIESRLITKRIAAAQKAVEAQNFASRKHVLEYDDVMNKQRRSVYAMRRALLEGANQKDRIGEIIRGIVATYIDQYCAQNVRADQYDFLGLQNALLNQFGVKLEQEDVNALSREGIEEHINLLLLARYSEKEQMIGTEHLREAERIIMLNVVDNQWKDHLLSMDHLKEGIGLRGYGQKDPLIEYKKESFTMFQDMMDRIEDETIRFLFLHAHRRRRDAAAVPGTVRTGPTMMAIAIEPEEIEPSKVTPIDQRAAQQSVLDLTRNIQKKKDRELAALQFTGGDESSTNANRQ